MNEQALKEMLESKRELILKVFDNRATLNKWDGHSPIWAYNVLYDEIQHITGVEAIKLVLALKPSGFVYFIEKEDVDTYKWLHDLIETEVENKLLEGWANNDST